MKLSRSQFLSTTIAAITAAIVPFVKPVKTQAAVLAKKAAPLPRHIPPYLAKLKEEVEALGFDFYWDQRAYIVEFFAYGHVVYRNSLDGHEYALRAVTLSYVKDVDRLSMMKYPEVFVTELLDSIRDVIKTGTIHPELDNIMSPVGRAIRPAEASYDAVEIHDINGKHVLDALRVYNS